MRFLTAFLFVGLVGAGCDSSPDSPEQSQLESALATWDVQGPSSYSFTWQQGCECSPEWTRPIRIKVVNDAIVEAAYVDTQLPVSADLRAHLLTIDGVFDTIQDAVANNAFAVNVQYDSNSGAPLSVAVDYEQYTADEELSLQISAFHSDVAHDLTSCGGPGGD
jgi:hypothetical protein